MKVALRARLKLRLVSPPPERYCLVPAADRPFNIASLSPENLCGASAPAEDLEILEGVASVVCPHCRYSFRSKPGVANKPGGCCECGGWICPACLACQGIKDGTKKGIVPACSKQRSRQIRKLAARKKSRDDRHR